MAPPKTTENTGTDQAAAVRAGEAREAEAAAEMLEKWKKEDEDMRGMFAQIDRNLENTEARLARA